MRIAWLNFECTKCDKPLQTELNVGGIRKRGENEITCDECGNHMEILIDIIGEPD